MTDDIDVGSRADAALVRAQDLAAQGDLAQAEDVARDGLRHDLGHFGLLNLLSQLAARRGAWTLASEWGLMAVGARPGDAAAAARLADAQLRCGDLDAAMATVRQALEHSPDDASLLCRASDLAMRAGEPDHALDWAHRSVERNPDHPFCHNQLTTILFQRGDFDGARASAREAIRLAPREAGFVCRLADIEFRSGYPDAALRLLADAVELDPACVRAHELASAVHLSRGDLERADTAGRAALDLDPASAALLCHMSDLARRRGATEEALAYAERAAAAHPSNHHCQGQLALVRLQTGDLDGAWAASAAALAVAPREPGLLVCASEIAARRGDAEQALELARRARDAAPGDVVADDVHLAALLAAGRLDDAAAAGEAALASHPGDIRLLCRMSEIARRDQRLADALAFADRAVEAAPGNPHAFAARAAALAAMDDLDGAENVVRQALDLAPETASLHRLRDDLAGRRAPPATPQEDVPAADPTEVAVTAQRAPESVKERAPDRPTERVRERPGRSPLAGAPGKASGRGGLRKFRNLFGSGGPAAT